MSLTCFRLLIHPALVGNVFLIDRIIALVFSLSRTTSSPDPLPSKASPDPPTLSLGGLQIEAALLGSNGGREVKANCGQSQISINLLFPQVFSTLEKC